ncbi:uncharacterized protein LOC132285161 [Cornus florida]|uniref:uncharacterized protein LOC132285161 n=1 Tax=Cornus florida TaxID=4283 RepID=UPI00289B20C5|nr:uncharacterized protein LOC132285161 [Cornus florida]
MVEEQETSDGYLGWNRIRYSHLQWTKTHFQSDPQTHWSMPMVAITDSSSTAAADDGVSVVFPPNDHEGLHISNQNQPNHHSPLPPSPQPPPPTPPLLSVSPYVVNGEDPSPPLTRWLRFGFGFLGSKVTGIASSLRYYAATRGTLWSFRSAAGTAAALLLLWLLHMKFRRQRHSRRIRRENEDQLLLVIKEKDKIVLGSGMGMETWGTFMKDPGSALGETMVFPAHPSLWDGVRKLTKSAQHKCIATRWWVIQFSSTLNLAEVSLLLTVVANLLISHNVGANNFFDHVEVP